MDERTKRLLSWANGKKAYPLSIELSPTLRCNINCLFCWRYGKKSLDFGEELSLKKYKDIINEAAEMDAREIRIIGGGEPLFRKDSFEIMKEVKSKGMFGYVCTNGTLFNRKTIEQLVRIGWDHVKISLHGSNAKTHDYLVNKDGAFERSVRAIRLFRTWKQKLKRKKPYLEIGVVLTRDNYKEVVDIVKLGHNLNVQDIFIEPVTVYTEMGKKLKLSKRDYKIFEGLAVKAEKMAKSFGIKNNLSNFMESRFIEKTGEMVDEIKKDIKRGTKDLLSAPCYEPWYRIGIRTDGWVCPCGFFDQETTENVKNRSLKSIWHGHFFNERREQILRRKLPPHCKKCCVTLVVNNRMIRSELEKYGYAQGQIWQN